MDEILDLESEVTATFNKNENLDQLHSLLHTNDLSDITEGSVIITEVPERDETPSSGTMNSKGALPQSCQAHQNCSQRCYNGSLRLSGQRSRRFTNTE